MKSKKIKAFLSMSLLSATTIAVVACGQTAKTQEKKDEFATKKENAQSLLNQIQGDKTNLTKQLAQARTATELDVVITKIQQLLQQQNPLAVLKQQAKDELDTLRDKKDYQNQINSAITKEALENIIAQIKEDYKNQSPLTGDEKITSDNQFRALIDKVTEGNEFSLAQINGFRNADRSQTTAKYVLENQGEYGIKVKPGFTGKFKAQLTNINYINNNEQDSQAQGAIDIFVTFTNPTTNTNISKNYRITGLKKETNNFITPSTPSGDKVLEYIKMNQEQRYQNDNTGYVEARKRFLGSDWKSFRDGAFKNVTDEEIQKFNAKAKEVGVSDYDSSVYKGFSTPVYKNDGSVDGLVINQGSNGTIPSWADTFGKTDVNKYQGLARLLTNEKYIDIAKQSFSININNYLISPDKAVQNKVKELLKNTEGVELKKFIEHIKDSKTKSELLNTLEKTTDVSVLAELKNRTYETLVKENGENAAGDFYVKYNQDYKNQKIAAVNASDLSQDVKTRTINLIQKNNNQFELLANSYGSFDNISGTMWIMDYELSNDNSYPTKFYFGTNLHVADAIKPGLFSSYSVTRLRKEAEPLLKKLKLVGLNNFNDKEKLFQNFALNPNSISRAFDARDFLKSKPADFLAAKQKQLYNDAEEFADFAVLEIDFSKVTDIANASNNSASASQDLAKLVTNDYKDWPENKKVKFLSNSYLKDYQKIDYPLASALNGIDQLFILGYPAANSGQWRDYFLDQYIDADQIAVEKYYKTIWTNADAEFYDTQFTNSDLNDKNSSVYQKLNRGNFLSYNLGYRSFAYKPGITDAFIAVPVLTNKNTTNPLDNLYQSDDNKKYINFGLEYLPRWYSPGGGASGSSVRNQDNKLVGIYHFSNTTARTGLIAAFRSEGYDYRGLFGNYNLPQYDLIYGGGKDQKNSYRQAMQTLASKSNQATKTYLFPNGFTEQQIPNDFKFTDIVNKQK
ncbi:putative peptidase DUF31 [Mycoplasmopsis mustelae]|uniref:Putative peptidase DUF31 n=1 Tax=Mycoplasmopsis mustelae TaxID=171289 RepID=A0A4R7UDJ2_9BACT|nr:DUF31 family protein [Mycoplasmopsis mustelae]TDV22871.1 putative peptidase DUF31 [Mycoplasmopsis mustelae]